MIQKSKRGQAAMEFLMTYGWAILVVLVVIGALAYFGVLSPDNLLPEKCTFPLQLSCKDFSAADTVAGPDSVTLSLVNGAGRSMIIRDMNVTSSEAIAVAGGCFSTAATQTGPVTSLTVANGDTVNIVLNSQRPAGATQNCAFANTGRPKDKFNFKVIYSWQDSPSINHELNGELLAKVNR
ncbi:hypothetical protein HYU11_03465 [Candidatus Woesearchaeota archaeon]|nr:hypothetical protein [Candidatus Woesearchaeota archaeon]